MYNLNGLLLRLTGGFTHVLIVQRTINLPV